MAAGLPNIVGSIAGHVVNEDGTMSASGCYSIWTISTSNAQGWEGDGSNKRYQHDMYASRSSAIYGKSSTVTPLSTSSKFYLKF